MSVANWILALLTNTTHFDHTSRTNDAKQSKSQEHQDTLSRIQSSCLRGVEMYHAYDGGQERSCLIYSQCGVTLDLHQPCTSAASEKCIGCLQFFITT